MQCCDTALRCTVKAKRDSIGQAPVNVVLWDRKEEGKKKTRARYVCWPVIAADA